MHQETLSARASTKIWGLSLAHFVTDLYSPVLTAILPLLVLNFGYTYLLAGLLVTAYNLTSSMAQPLIGWLFDKRGRGIHVSVSLLISAFFISLIGLTSVYPLILLFAILAALGHASFHPSGLAQVGAECTDCNRGRLMSYFVIGGNFGYAIGPLLAGMAIGWLGFGGLALFFLPGFIMALLARRIIPSMENPPAPPSGERAAGSGVIPVTILVLGAALRAWAIFASIAYIPPLLIQRGLDLVLATGLVTAMLLAGVAGQVAGGVLSDRYGRKEYSILGMAMAIPFFLLFISTTGLLSYLALLLFGMTLWSTFAVTVAIAQEMMPRNIGLASGLVLGLAVGGGGIGVAVTGALADATSLSSALVLLPVPILAAIGCFLILPYPWRTIGRKRMRSAGK
ncbi:MAG: MFS transporter [Methanomicrobiales archaeon]|nr:MFS transporter [Methanomicrobiales archaeon]